MATELTEDLNIRLCSWLYEKQGVYNCILRVDGVAYRLNQTMGLSRATDEDVANFPEVDPPEWLVSQS